MRLLKYSFLIAVLCFAASTAHSQCRSFTKNDCLPLLEDFTPNENYNSALFAAGESAELGVTFNEGKTYRVVVCGQSVLGDIQFQLIDSDDEILYDNANNEMAKSYDFKVAGTQQLSIKVIVPEDDSGVDLVQQGCVTIALGHKESPAD